jgi:hypothetical protein
MDLETFLIYVRMCSGEKQTQRCRAERPALLVVGSYAAGAYALAAPDRELLDPAAISPVSSSSMVLTADCVKVDPRAYYPA